MLRWKNEEQEFFSIYVVLYFINFKKSELRNLRNERVEQAVAVDAVEDIGGEELAIVHDGVELFLEMLFPVEQLQQPGDGASAAGLHRPIIVRPSDVGHRRIPRLCGALKQNAGQIFGSLHDDALAVFLDGPAPVLRSEEEEGVDGQVIAQVVDGRVHRLSQRRFEQGHQRDDFFDVDQLPQSSF